MQVVNCYGQEFPALSPLCLYLLTGSSTMGLRIAMGLPSAVLKCQNIYTNIKNKA